MKLRPIFYLLLAIFTVIESHTASAQNKGNSSKIEVVVHRGANKLAPENTIPSAFAALKHGATWIELDVRCSKDGVMYNLHDETLDRTTNGHGAINEMISTEIDKLDAGSWFDSKFTGLHVPRIAEMLDTLRGHANAFFDVKRCVSVTDLISLTRQKGFADKSFFWFADPTMLETFVKLAPDMKVKVNASNIKTLRKWMKVCRPSYVEIQTNLITPRFRKFCHRHNIKIIAAIQGTTEQGYCEAILAAPDMVNLDCPEIFNDLMQKMKAEQELK